MMTKRKIWTGLGVVATAATVSAGAIAADAPAQKGDYPGATLEMTVPFSRALQKILDGEGGEGGIGYTKAGAVFEIPSLNDDQLKQALPGRTIRKDQAVAIYFGPDGQVDGWKRDWSKASADQCPTPLGDNHEIEDGQCWTSAVNPIKGPYTIKNGSVCMPAYSGKAADGQGCYYIAFVSKHVMIADGKRTYGSGKDLVDGKNLDVFRKKADH